MKVISFDEIPEKELSHELFTGEVTVKRIVNKDIGSQDLSLAIVSFPKGVVNYFHAQGEDAKDWLDIFMEGGAKLLIETLTSVNLMWPSGQKAEHLSEVLDHETIGDLAITYSAELKYIAVGKKKEVYSG